MRVGEELLGVLLDLFESEAYTSILAVLDHTGAEWALETADSVAALLVADGVGEGDTNTKSAFHSSNCVQACVVDLPWRPRLALDSLVDVGGSVGGRLVVTSEAIQGDVIADDIFVRVDAKLEEALAALQSASVLVVCINNLIRGSKNFPDRSESERDATLRLKETKDALLMLHVRSWRGSSEGAESNGKEREFHVCSGLG